MAVKGNQKNLEQDVLSHVQKQWESHPKDELPDHFHEEFNRGHGRDECRCCWAFNDLGALRNHDAWPGLKQFRIVQADRTIDGIATTSLRF